MTFAHWEFDAGSDIHEHSHPQEEVWEILEGELEVTVGGVTRVARPGVVAIVPPDTPHSVRALTDGRAIVIDYPLREMA
jgi:quercetin dioxygenase-like cupin family protein